MRKKMKGTPKMQVAMTIDTPLNLVQSHRGKDRLCVIRRLHLSAALPKRLKRN